jgi:hypothetical protein
MTIAIWKRIGIIAGAVIGVSTVVGLARPFLISDDPPWASRATVIASEQSTLKRIDQSANMIIIRIVVGNMLAMQARFCEARRSGRQEEAQSLANIIAGLQNEHRGYAGYEYPLPPCV